MNFTVSTIAKSLADYLAPEFPDVEFYEDPNQQETKTPCFFLQQRYSRLIPQTDMYWIRTIGLDLTYLVDYNLPNTQRLYQEAAERLDLVMEVFPYCDGKSAETALIRTYDREWRVDLDAMHYKFEIKERVKIPEEYAKMRTIQEYNEEVYANVEK